MEERAENRAQWRHAAESPMLCPEPKRLNELAPLKKQALSKQADQNKTQNQRVCFTVLPPLTLYCFQA